MSTTSKLLNSSGFFVTIAVVIWLMIAACLPVSEPSPQLHTPTPMSDVSTPESTSNTLVSQQGTPTPTDIWLALLQKVPHPYTTPLPAQTPTSLDGIYVKLESKDATPVPCRRCPDYLPAGGTWRLNLDKGVFRIFHEATGWRSLGSFTVSGDQIVLFNDPTCFRTTGIYEWQLEEGQLSLRVIEDTCHVDRRARSFTNSAWVSCQPPSTEAGVTNHWPKPSGCENDQ